MSPTIFLRVAAFLLNVVVTRQISTQREQIATLKAFGYTNFDVVCTIWSSCLIVLIVLAAAAGIGFGVWMGRGMGGMYMESCRFPYLLYGWVRKWRWTPASSFAAAVRARSTR